LTSRENAFIIEILQKRTTIALPAQARETPYPSETTPYPELQEQSGQLVGYLDTLFRRLMLPRKTGDEAELELSREEVRALVILDAGPHSVERIMMSSLAESLGVPLSTATHTVDRLVAKGLVVRKRSESDRRVVEVEMSDYGRKLQAEFREKRRSMASSWLEPLSGYERERFLDLMSKITLLAQPGPES
jgi:DNA-binding MarR family transcriptional regulator